MAVVNYAVFSKISNVNSCWGAKTQHTSPRQISLQSVILL